MTNFFSFELCKFYAMVHGTRKTALNQPVESVGRTIGALVGEFANH
jgi:hypothetical protein